LRAFPKRWSSWDFTVQDESGHNLGDVALSSWRERGVVRCDGAEHHVFREGALRGAFVLDGAGESLRALKPSAFRNLFDIEFGQERYVLSPRSAFRQDRLLYHEGREMGSIVAEGPLSRRARIQLPDDLPLVLILFLLWLTLLQWKREADAAAGS
jgi:hypothetical protein